ncbi:MAG: SET domain-containing protein [Anaerolineales bacterium]|nr:SET domain-containing protein [Anaerolineales bacterium]
MIHPDTTLKWINSQVGYGVFATAFIAHGTVVYVQDPLEIVIKEDSLLLRDPNCLPHIEKYAYFDEEGNRIISWDIAKYVNHCCHSNTLSTGYGFEIAVRDIQPGEEITDEYALFTSGLSFPLACHYSDCRQLLQPGDREKYGRSWDDQIQAALFRFYAVPQPLSSYISADIINKMTTFINTGTAYLSVQTVRQ